MNRGGLLRYILKRLLIAVPVLIGITLIDYLLMNLAGNPIDMLIGPRVTEAAKVAKMAELGLDQPFLVRYWLWLTELMRGNMGYSLMTYQPVTQMIAQNLSPTLLLMGTSMLLSFLISIPLGIYSALKQYTLRDYAIVGTAFLFISIPGFFLALVLVYLFSTKLGWLPSSGMKTLGGAGGMLDTLRHIIMPVLVLAASVTGSNIRYIRSSMLEILQQPYLRTAEGKGIGRFKVIGKHAFRNAMIPIVTLIGLQLPMLLGGAVVVEQIFSWPGLGLMTMSAILNRDFPVIMGVSLLAAIAVLMANIITDILYAIVDPTIRYD